MESDQVLTMMVETVLGAEGTKVAGKESEVRAGLERARAWLATQKPAGSTQAVAVRLFRDVRAGVPRAQIATQIDQLLALQHADGGWGHERELPSDAYATGQALYFLSLAGVARDRAEIRRGVAFLVASQRKDGSWPMKSRAHPGAKPMTNPVPITYFGTAWATLGLMSASRQLRPERHAGTTRLDR
jgi:hypothetical protein